MASMATYGPYEAIDAIIMITSGVDNIQINAGGTGGVPASSKTGSILMTAVPDDRISSIGVVRDELGSRR